MSAVEIIIQLLVSCFECMAFRRHKVNTGVRMLEISRMSLGLMVSPSGFILR